MTAGEPYKLTAEDFKRTRTCPLTGRYLGNPDDRNNPGDRDPLEIFGIPAHWPGMPDMADAEDAGRLTADQQWEIRQLGRWPVPKCRRVLESMRRQQLTDTPAYLHLTGLLEALPYDPVTLRAPVAQLEEPHTTNVEDAGSSPAGRATVQSSQEGEPMTLRKSNLYSDENKHNAQVARATTGSDITGVEIELEEDLDLGGGRKMPAGRWVRLADG